MNKERSKRRRKKHQTGQNYHKEREMSEMMKRHLSRRGGARRRNSKENPVRAAGDGESNNIGKQAENKKKFGRC